MTSFAGVVRRRRRRPTLDPDPGPGVAFHFEGRPMTAQPGQTIAGALLANGVDVFTRSFKLHRPRGYTCGFGACPNCPMTVDGLPGVDACTTVITGGEHVRRERGMPSADVDVLRLLDLAKRWLPAGFQFRWFAEQPSWSRRFERGAARIAGAGRLPTSAAAARHRAANITTEVCDVVVVGGGRAGCRAALEAADAGPSVKLVERYALGGRSRVRTARVELPDGRHAPAYEAAAMLAQAVRDHPAIDVLQGTALGWFEDGVLPVVHAGGVAELQPRSLIIATGSYETPGLFAGNDLPGVMLADGTLRLITLERLRPGRRAVVLTDSSRGYRVADRLADAGVAVVAVVDERGGIPDEDRSPLPGLRVVRGGRVRRAWGWTRLFAVTIRMGGRSRLLRADLLCVALERRPADELVLQARYIAGHSPRGNSQPGTDPAERRPEIRVRLVGSAGRPTSFRRAAVPRR